MAQVINILATDECQLNLDLTGDYDVLLNSVTGTMNIPIVAKDEDYVTYSVDEKKTITIGSSSESQTTITREPGQTYRVVVGQNVYATGMINEPTDLIQQFYGSTTNSSSETGVYSWYVFVSLLSFNTLTNHFKFQCNILDASIRMKYVLGIRHVFPKVGEEAERPYSFGVSPYYFIYVDNAKCRSRFVWQHDYYNITKPTLSSTEKLDEQYNLIPSESQNIYNKQLYNTKYVATQQILAVIYNSFAPGQMFQFSGGQFSCTGENLSNVKFKIVGLFGERMSNYSEVLWNFQLAPAEQPERPPGVTKEGLAQLEAEEAEQEAAAAQEGGAEGQPEQEAQASTSVEDLQQIVMELKEENKKLLKMIMDQHSAMKSHMVEEKKEDLVQEAVAKRILDTIARPQPTYIGPVPQPYRPIKPLPELKPKETPEVTVKTEHLEPIQPIPDTTEEQK